MKKKILIGILSFVVCLTFGLGCYFISGGKISLTTSAPQPPEQTQTEISGNWRDNGNYSASLSGNGKSESDPYLIQSAQDLAYLSAYGNTFSGIYFKMTADVDMSAHYWQNNGESFCGVFDGNNHKITGVNLNNSNLENSLFYSSSGATIKNISLLEAKCTSVSRDAAALVGECSDTTISYVNVNFKLEMGEFSASNNYIGGLFAYGSDMTVTNCTANVDISCGSTSNSRSHTDSNTYIGGIAGNINDSSYSSSPISNFTACNTHGKITYRNPSSGSNIDIRDISIGGVVGQSNDRIAFESCVNNIDITLSGAFNSTGTVALGGILGRLTNTEGIAETSLFWNYLEEYYNYVSDWQEYNSIKNSLNNGYIYASYGYKVSAGGICGVSDGVILIRLCINKRYVEVLSGTGSVSESGLGGIIGKVSSTSDDGTADSRKISIITDCLNDYWIGNSSSTTYAGGVGGIVGSGYLLKINRCINRKDIYNKNNVGGIIGYVSGKANSVVIGNSINSGYLHCNGTCKGQIIGYAPNVVVNFLKCHLYYCYGVSSYGNLGYSPFTYDSNIDNSTALRSSTDFSSETFFTNKNWLTADTSVYVSGVEIVTKLLGFDSETNRNIYPQPTYFSSHWLNVNGAYYPLNYAGYASIGGVYLRANDSSDYQEIWKSGESDSAKRSLLTKLFKEIKFGSKAANLNSSYISSQAIFSQTSITITCESLVKVSAVTSSAQLYYDQTPSGVNSKENPVFQKDLNISSIFQSGNNYSCNFTPTRDQYSNLSAPLYIYLTATGQTSTGMPGFKPEIKYVLINQDGSLDTTSSVSTYLNTTQTTFDGKPISGNITLQLFKDIKYSITPQFGYAFYGISSSGSYNSLDIANNTYEKVENNDRKNASGGNAGSRNNKFYLGNITGSFNFYLQDLTVFVKEVEYTNYTIYFDESSFGQIPVVPREITDNKIILRAHDEDGYVVDVYLAHAGSVGEDPELLYTFVDVNNDAYKQMNEDFKNYYTLNFEDIKAKSKEKGYTDVDVLGVFLKRRKIKTEVVLNDYLNYYYNTNVYEKADSQLTQFEGKDNNKSLCFDANTNTLYDDTATQVNNLCYTSKAEGYLGFLPSVELLQTNVADYAGAAEKYNQIQDKGKDGYKLDFSVSKIYSEYLKYLLDNDTNALKNYLNPENGKDGDTLQRTINLFIYYALQEYTVDIACLDVNGNGGVDSSVSLKTNEDKKSATYSDTAAYTTSVDSESKIHYNSGLKLDLTVAEGERLVGVYINDNFVTNSLKDPLIFYYSKEISSSEEDSTLEIRVYFAKYEQGNFDAEKGETPPTPERGVYYISKPQDLVWLSYQVATGNTFENFLIKQTRDIDMSGIDLNPIGGVLDNGTVRAFKGTYDGSFYRITNLSFIGGNYQNNLSYMGLFGYVEDATIMNLMVEGTQLAGWANVGGVVGYAKNSTFTRVDNRSLELSLSTQTNMLSCTNVTFITADGDASKTNTVAVCENLGGLVGYAEGCLFLGCSNQAIISDTAAGLVGKMNGGSLDQCFTENGSIVANKENDPALKNYYDSTDIQKDDDSKWTVDGKLKIFYWWNEIS